MLDVTTRKNLILGLPLSTYAQVNTIVAFAVAGEGLLLEPMTDGRTWEHVLKAWGAEESLMTGDRITAGSVNAQALGRLLVATLAYSACPEYMSDDLEKAVADQFIAGYQYVQLEGMGLDGAERALEAFAQMGQGYEFWQVCPAWDLCQALMGRVLVAGLEFELNAR